MSESHEDPPVEPQPSATDSQQAATHGPDDGEHGPAAEAADEAAAGQGDTPADAEPGPELAPADAEPEAVPAKPAAVKDPEAEDPFGSAEDRKRLKAAVEALIFVSDRVITPLQLGRILKLKSSDVRTLVDEVAEDYAERGIQLAELSGGYQFRSAPACASYVQSLVAQKPVRLTRAQLETLALVAYRQPITRPEVDDVRGVDTGSAVKVLLERGLIKMLGRKEDPGRPMLYGTTPFFLEFFGLKTLRDLPTLREFTDLSEENRSLFKKKTGEAVEDAQADLEAAATEESDETGDGPGDDQNVEGAVEAGAEAEGTVPDADAEPEANADTTVDSDGEAQLDQGADTEVDGGGDSDGQSAPDQDELEETDEAPEHVDEAGQPGEPDGDDDERPA